MSPFAVSDAAGVPRRAIIRADASPQTGGGHVMRCTTLAGLLHEQGWMVTLAATSVTFEMMRALLPDWIREIQLTADESLDPEALRARLPEGYDLLVVDHYSLDRAYEAPLRGWAHRVAALDDLADRAHEVDVLIDQTPGRADHDYAGFVPANCSLLLGSDYALLREQFAIARLVRPRPPRLLSAPYRVLVSAGLGDHEGLSLRLLDGIDASGLDCEILVLVGSRSPALPELHLRSRGRKLRIAVDSDEIAAHLSWADLAIGAAGTSSWERCSLGVPSLLLISAANQKRVADALERAGAALILRGQDSADDLGEAIRALLLRPDALSSMSTASSQVCDGLGAGRIALHLDPEYADDAHPVWMRRFHADHEDIVFRWQTADGVRRYSRNPNPPTRAEHAGWTADRLARIRAVTEIAIHDDQPVGIVRLDPHEDGTWEVSILIDPAKHGCGIGAAALRGLRRLVPHLTIRAAVDPCNAPSLALFRKLGYVAIDDWLISAPSIRATIAA